MRVLLQGCRSAEMSDLTGASAAMIMGDGAADDQGRERRGDAIRRFPIPTEAIPGNPIFSMENCAASAAWRSPARPPAVRR